ncbi:MAG: PD-(D/E)XK nuclease family protein, partial [Oscillospiraceae bacterium]|nr:PD-(D/E)XK nuclease family protein [Oscillospiraceae bacterium]
ALLRHPDAHILRETAGLAADLHLQANTHMQFFVKQIAPPEEIDAQTGEAQAPSAPDEALRSAVRERLDYRYPYEALHNLAAKTAVSALTEQAQQDRFAFAAQPAFLREGSISAAQRGTAMHAFLQYADYARAGADLLGEIDRLAALGYLTTHDVRALEKEKLARFFAGAFARRMLASPRLLREKKFTLRIPAAEFARDDALVAAQAEDETIVVQGIIDCAFEENGALVLLDYKTDRVESMDMLRARYSGQLTMYRRAMRECFGMEVSETLIYSFWLNEWIEI